MNIKIAPSILSADFANLERDIRKIDTADYVHVDIMAVSYTHLTSINAELKDSKRNLPKALLIGGLIIVATYILYYIGVAGGATNQAPVSYTHLPP